MIRVRLDHIPGVADQDFECETAEQAVEVLDEYGVGEAAAWAAIAGDEICLTRGGTITVSTRSDGR